MTKNTVHHKCLYIISVIVFRVEKRFLKIKRSSSYDVIKDGPRGLKRIERY